MQRQLKIHAGHGDWAERDKFEDNISGIRFEPLTHHLVSGSRVRNLAKLGLWIYDNTLVVRQHFKMSDYLDAGPDIWYGGPKVLDMDHLCGTTCCLAGWGPTAGIPWVGDEVGGKYSDWIVYVRTMFTADRGTIFNALFSKYFPDSPSFAVWRIQELFKGQFIGSDRSSDTVAYLEDKNSEAAKTWLAGENSMAARDSAEFDNIWRVAVDRAFLEDIEKGDYKL